MGEFSVAVLAQPANVRRPAANQSLACNAEAVLSQSAYLPLRRLWCDDLDGILVLQVEVPTPFLRRLAESIVGRLEGVNRIDNQVRLVLPGSQRLRRGRPR